MEIQRLVYNFQDQRRARLSAGFPPKATRQYSRARGVPARDVTARIMYKRPDCKAAIVLYPLPGWFRTRVKLHRAARTTGIQGKTDNRRVVI